MHARVRASANHRPRPARAKTWWDLAAAGSAAAGALGTPTHAFTDGGAGSAAAGAHGSRTDGESAVLVEFGGSVRTVYNAQHWEEERGEEGEEDTQRAREHGHTHRRATRPTCSAAGGEMCCRVPPCKCGTYVSCLDDECLSARCEFCPEGFFCNCDAACARLQVADCNLSSCGFVRLCLCRSLCART